MPTLSLPPDANTPHRPPDWRWERASWLIARGQTQGLRTEDQFVRTVRRYQIDRKAATTERPLARLAARCPGLYYAQEILQDPNQAVRWAVEARLLAGQSLDAIAARSGLSVATVYWYECAFFNVLDRLGARDYIATVVIGEDAQRGINSRH